VGGETVVMKMGGSGKRRGEEDNCVGYVDTSTAEVGEEGG